MMLIVSATNAVIEAHANPCAVEMMTAEMVSFVKDSFVPLDAVPIRIAPTICRASTNSAWIHAPVPQLAEQMQNALY